MSQFKKTYVYTKGPNPDPNYIPLPNIGREAHTFLHHIVNNYDRLDDDILFTNGGICKGDHRSNIFKACLNGTPGPYMESLGPARDFTIEHWAGSTGVNGELVLAETRPFSEWYTKNIKEFKDDYIWTPNGIFRTTRDQILKRPKSYYEELLRQASAGTSTEVAHYLERSWYSLFN
jgi:hypothetical protein